MSRRWLACLCLAAAMLGGCGGSTGGGSGSRAGGSGSRAGGSGRRARGSGRGGLSRQARALAAAAATHEYPSPPPPAQRAPGAVSPVQAVTAFARLYINWNAQDVSARMTGLARSSVGQARSEMNLAAAETRSDTTLQQGKIANRGAVEAVARVIGQPEEYVVVTRETTVAAATTAYQGLGPAWHLTLATVALAGRQTSRRWVISGWQPEN